MSTFITTAPPQTRAEALTRRAVAMIGIATLFAVIVIALAGFGEQGRTGPLGWSGDSDLFTHPTIPGDRIVTGTLRNDGTHPIRVDIGDVRLLDDDGSVVASTPVFLQTFGKSLWAAGRGPQQVPDTELQRTGRIALLTPGEEVPLTIAWHDKDGKPSRIDYGEGSLPIGG
ncbi:MAG TPA: hypothetical protein VFX51_23800 [Solirubrobacteraceae bacterium]|nr:hypothetical protein [Solirubrobacteraceae bacterium]